MKVTAYSLEGTAHKAKVELPAALFDGTVNEAVLHQVVTAIRAHGRQGTSATKTRQTIRGGGRKPWRQKGTGRARAGSVRSPLWRGGAVVFGPQPREYNPRVPRRLKRLAIRSALNARAMDGGLSVIDALDMEAPKTRTVAALVEAVTGGSGDNVLILTDGVKRAVYLSARNLPGVMVKPWGEASAYDVLWADRVLVERVALNSARAESAEERPDAAPVEAEAVTGSAADEGPEDETDGGDE
ncbi:MAG: 50S ribosomal protein L4 [Gemmatimonadota bacterium]